jgi:hypothetical protein
VRELPPNVINPSAPAGTPPAQVAHPGSFWCSHGTEFEWDGDVGGYMVSGNARDDDLHPKDLPIAGQGALPELCQPASGLDPVKHPNVGPVAVERATAEVELEHARERRERRERGA